MTIEDIMELTIQKRLYHKIFRISFTAILTV